MAGEYAAVDEHDTSAEVAQMNAADELASMRQRHDELVRRLDSVSPRAPLWAEPSQEDPVLDTACGALSLEVQPEAEDTGASMEEDIIDMNAHRDFLLTSIGAKLAAIPCMWVFNILVSVGMIVAQNTYSDEAKTWLGLVFDICVPLGGAIMLLGSGLSLEHVTAAGGPLELLGAGKTRISKRSYDTQMRRSYVCMLVPVVFFVMLALLCFVSATRVGTRSKLTDRLITESYAVAVFFAGLMYLIMVVTFWPFWITLKMASALVVDAVSETKQKIEECTPASAEWELEVVQRVLGLCTDTLPLGTLPLLSKGWGAGVVAVFVGAWVCALGYFAQFLESGTIASALLMAIAAVAPVAVAYDAASASTDCNMLSDALTKKRMDRLQDHSDDPLHDLHHENTIRSLELILDRQNRQQGLGFTVRKIVVDLKLLASIMATLCGFGATVVPILFALRSGAAGESFTAGTDICSFTGAVDQSRSCWDIFSAHLHYRC
jgi:hypothetical protein